jgi:hypothetical protein
MCLAMYIAQNGRTSNDAESRTTTELLFTRNLTQICHTVVMFHFVWGVLYMACYYAITSSKPLVKDLLQGSNSHSSEVENADATHSPVTDFNWLLLSRISSPLLFSEDPGIRNSIYLYPAIDFHLFQCLLLFCSIQSVSWVDF